MTQNPQADGLRHSEFPPAPALNFAPVRDCLSRTGFFAGKIGRKA